MIEKVGPNIIETAPETTQLVTFKVGDIVLAVVITSVQEINRNLHVTEVPGASKMIHGVVNLRGDVVTVLDPHRIFGLSASAPADRQRNLILNVGDERIGVLVDEVSDILTIRPGDLSRRPSNVTSIDRNFIESVYLREDEIVVVLNADHLLSAAGGTNLESRAVA